MIAKVKVFDTSGVLAFEWSFIGHGGPSENAPLTARDEMVSRMRAEGCALPDDIKGWRFTLVVDDLNRHRCALKRFPPDIRPEIRATYS